MGFHEFSGIFDFALRIFHHKNWVFTSNVFLPYLVNPTSIYCTFVISAHLHSNIIISVYKLCSTPTPPIQCVKEPIFLAGDWIASLVLHNRLAIISFERTRISRMRRSHCNKKKAQVSDTVVVAVAPHSVISMKSVLYCTVHVQWTENLLLSRNNLNL